MKELRDYGMSEMTIDQNAPNNKLWRRGTELVIWANSDAGNYDNYIKYHFRDNGQVFAYVGTSGWNSNNLFADFYSEDGNGNDIVTTGMARSGWAPHLHSTLWRVHPKIGDWRLNDKVYKVSYNQDLNSHNGREKVNVDQFLKEIEFNDEEDEYLSVLFEDPETVNGKNIGYMVNRISEGSTRHRIMYYRNLGEEYSDYPDHNKVKNDYYLRKYNSNELGLQFLGTQLLGAVEDATIYLDFSKDEPEWIDQGGAVLFATTSIKHIPRNEDFVVRPREEYPAYVVVTRTTDNTDSYTTTNVITDYGTNPPTVTSQTSFNSILFPSSSNYLPNHIPRDGKSARSVKHEYRAYSQHYNYYINNSHRNSNQIKWHGVSMTPRNIQRSIPFAYDKPCSDCPLKPTFPSLSKAKK